MKVIQIETAEKYEHSVEDALTKQELVVTICPDRHGVVLDLGTKDADCLILDLSGGTLSLYTQSDVDSKPKKLASFKNE